jgi:enoyl-CoA hydratase
MSSNEVLKIERKEGVALITLNRPEARNALNAALASAIVRAFDECQDAGCLVITGADPAFCAGLDLRNLGVEKLGDLPPFWEAVASSKVPLIGAVNGPAVTGGFELALACDFLVGSERARFADTHGRVGVYPGPVLYDLPARVGVAFAKEMSLTGNFIDAETALRVGILNHLVPHEELLPLAMRLATDIASQDPNMVRGIREGLKEVGDVSLSEGREVWRTFPRPNVVRGSQTGVDLAGRREEVLKRSRQQRDA